MTLKSTNLQKYFVWSYRPVQGLKGKVTRQVLGSAGSIASVKLQLSPFMY